MGGGGGGRTTIAINFFLFVCTLVFLVYLLICLFVRLVCICANPIKIACVLIRPSNNCNNSYHAIRKYF